MIKGCCTRQFGMCTTWCVPSSNKPSFGEFRRPRMASRARCRKPVICPEITETGGNPCCAASSFKERRAVFALGIALVVLAALFALRYFAHRGTRALGPRLLPSASSAARASASSGVRAASAVPPQSPSSASASAPNPPRPPAPPYLDTTATTLVEQRSALFTNMRNQLDLPAGALDKIEAIFTKSDWLGQGNPKITKHPMTRAECRAIREAHPELHSEDPRCNARYMVPLFDPAKGESANTANVCIDQFEFPNIPCEYPVTWVRSSEAD